MFKFLSLLSVSSGAVLTLLTNAGGELGNVVIAQEDPAGETDTANTEVLSVEQIVERVQGFYDTVESYHAEFRQTYNNIALGQADVSTGQVYFLKPGRMRWDYTSPDEKYLISDGSTLWMYEAEFNQVAEFELASSDLPTAISFLMGEGDLARDFEIVQADTCSEEDAYCLNLTPRIDEGQYRSLRFVVDAHNFSVRETTIIDPIGNRNEFVFVNASTTDPLPVEGFTFVPPDDARVITP